MKIKSSILFTITLSTTLSALQFQTIGYKSISMGGATVASSASSTAVYNNPALLAKSVEKVEVSLGLGIAGYDHGAGASYQALMNSDFEDAMDEADENVDNLSQNTINTLFDSRDIILNIDKKGFELSPQGYIGAQVYEYGFGIFTTSDIVAVANISQIHDQLIFENNDIGYQKILENGNIVSSNQTEYDSTSLEAGITDGYTYFDAIGIVLTEVPIAYSHSFELSQGLLHVGGALKYMNAITYVETILLDDEENNNEDSRQDETSSNFGIDLGVAYEPYFVKNLTLGLVIKNLNSPKFGTVGKDITIDPMVRIGAAYNINKELEVALDIDVTSNKTLIPGLDSQTIGGGINYMPVDWFSIRGGLMTNISSKDKAGMVYTAGMGIGPQWLQIDLSAQISGSSTDVDVDGDDYSYPQYAKVNLALISRW